MKPLTAGGKSGLRVRRRLARGGRSVYRLALGPALRADDRLEAGLRFFGRVPAEAGVALGASPRHEARGFLAGGTFYGQIFGAGYLRPGGLPALRAEERDLVSLARTIADARPGGKESIESQTGHAQYDQAGRKTDPLLMVIDTSISISSLLFGLENPQLSVGTLLRTVDASCGWPRASSAPDRLPQSIQKTARQPIAGHDSLFTLAM